MHAALFPYVWRYGEQCCRADDRPGESRSCRGVVARPVLAQERLRGRWCSGWLTDAVVGRFEGAVDEGPYAAQWPLWRCLVPARPNSAGTLPQCPTWCDSGGDGRTGPTATGMTDPAGPTSRRGPV
jgi:hypothetical protein